MRPQESPNAGTSPTLPGGAAPGLPASIPSDATENATNIQITGNLFAGAEWVVYANDWRPSQASPSGGHSVTNISFTNNVFSTYVHGCVGKWGVWYTTNNAYGGGPTDGWHSSGNKVLETGAGLDNGDVCR